MDRNKILRYNQLDANTENNTIRTVEVSKTTKAKNKKGDGSNDQKPRMNWLQRKLVEMEQGMVNAIGGLDAQLTNRGGGDYDYNNARLGPQPGYAPPTSQDPPRSEGGVLPFLTKLESDLLNSAGRAYHDNVHPRDLAGQSSSGSEADSIIQLEGEPHRFTYNQLRVATRGFSEEATLGRGGFGSVYRGMLPSGPVAVKRMNHGIAGSQGLKEFKAEVSIISQLRHRNLIELLGWCEDSARKEYMVVYELMPNGSLDDLLFKPVEGNSPSWPQRFKILTGTADVLAYLHHGSKKQVLHRDIKCSNIMLDKDWNAILGDFGIARLQDHKGEANTTNMAGTMGYIAPEVFFEGRFTEKADVYAFGVVVLEVACGRRVLPRHAQDTALLPWVRQSLSKGDLLSTVDKQLLDCDMHQMKMVLMIGLACCHNNPWERPSMRHVAQMLAGDAHEELTKLIQRIEHEGRTNWGAQVGNFEFSNDLNWTRTTSQLS